MKEIIQVKKNREWGLFACMALAVAVLILIMTKSDLADRIPDFATQVGNRDEQQIIRNFTTGMTVRQEFVCSSDFDYLTLSFSDHDQSIAGKTYVMVQEPESGNQIYQELDNRTIHYAVPVKISMDQLGGGKAGITYLVTIGAADTQETALGVYGYVSDTDQALVNGEYTGYRLSIGAHTYTNAFHVVTALILGIGIMGMFLTAAGTFVFRLKAQQIFLILAIPFGICMMLLGEGNPAYDEPRHYHTVYHYSNVILGKAGNDSGTSIQMRLCDVPDEAAKADRNVPVNGQAQDFWFSLGMWNEPADNTMVSVDISDMPVVGNGTVLEYLPAVTGMTIARLLGFNYFWMRILTKAVLFVFYLVICYYAIKTTPVLKMGLVFVSALPMSLYQSSGISYDGFTCCIGVLIFSLLMKLWKEGFERKDWWILGAMIFILGSCKGGVYLTIILLMAAVPKERFPKGKWRTCLITALWAGVSLLFFFAPVIVRWFSLGSIASGQDIPITNTESGTIQIAYALKQPLSFLMMFVRTLIEKADVYVGQALGYRTAWSNRPIALAVMLPFLILMLLSAAKTENDDLDIPVRGKLLILGMLLIELLGMHIIFLVETSVYATTINGFQGRYFILFLPFILLLLRHSGLEFRQGKEQLYPMFSMAQAVYLFFFIKMFLCD